MALGIDEQKDSATAKGVSPSAPPLARGRGETCQHHVSRKGAEPAKRVCPAARSRGATCQLRPPTPSRWLRVKHARKGAGPRCLWGGGLALRLPRAALISARPYSIEGRRNSERSLSFGARLWCDVLAAASSAKPAAVCYVRVRGGAGARCLWGESSALKISARARRAALVAISSYPKERRCTGERRLFFIGGRICCEPVSAALRHDACPCIAARWSTADGASVDTSADSVSTTGARAKRVQ